MKIPLLIYLLLSAGMADAAIRFDGQNLFNLSRTSPSPSLNFTNEISVAFWIKLEAGNSAGAEYLGKGRVNNGNVLHWSILNSSGKYAFNFANPDSRFHLFSTSSTFTATNTWNHLAFCYRWTDSNTAQFYVNGSKVTGVWTANPTNCVGLTNSEPMVVGALYTGSTMRGELAEIGVWNTYLTDGEIQALFRSRTTGSPLYVRRDTLRAYWPLNRSGPPYTQPLTNATYDLSMNGNTLNNYGTTQNRPGFWASP